MSLQDPIAQLITMVNNAQQANKETVVIRFSKIKKSICSILQDEGYILSYNVIKEESKSFISIVLKYVDGVPAINMFKRVSKCSCRVYRSAANLPSVMNGLGVLIVSTPNGVCTAEKARASHVGGELICKIF